MLIYETQYWAFAKIGNASTECCVKSPRFSTYVCFMSHVLCVMKDCFMFYVS